MGMETERISRWAFTAFVVIAIVMGLVVGYMAYNANLHFLDPDVSNINGWITLILLILGIIIGLTSITVKEVEPFLIATIALIVASSANVWEPLGNIHQLLFYWATTITNYIVAFAAPAAVIIGVRAIIVMARAK
jgi:hypothetical protein